MKETKQKGDIMKCVLQKGIAGLGNRLQVLGYCVDIAEKTGRIVVPDWRDTSWRLGFRSCFGGFQSHCLGKSVWPPPWKLKNVGCKCPKEFFKGDGGKTTFNVDEIPENKEVIVVCRYIAPFSNKLFTKITINKDIVQEANDWLKKHGIKPYTYRCWHIRHRDKRTEEGALKEAYKQIKKGDVIITDNAECGSWGLCPSYIVKSKTPKKGLHHLKVQRPEKSKINRSSVIDMIIGGLAKEFYPVCSHSSYGQFIERGHKADYWKQYAE